MTDSSGLQTCELRNSNSVISPVSDTSMIRPCPCSNISPACVMSQGIQASLIGILPYAAIRLGVYDGLKWSHRKHSKQEQIPPVPTMVYGAIAGLISASATFPVEVVRSVLTCLVAVTRLCHYQLSSTQKDFQQHNAACQNLQRDFFSMACTNCSHDREGFSNWLWVCVCVGSCMRACVYRHVLSCQTHLDLTQ